MKKAILCLVLSLAPVFGADLGVLYNSTNNNTVSPSTLRFNNAEVVTNLTLLSKTASRALVTDANTNVTTSTLSSTQVTQLATIVGGLTKLVLGGSEIVSGEGSPTNGTAYVQRILYINSLGTNLNDTFWGNWGTNWYAIASTNGGSIIENQINFSDNTTGDVSTNMHGFAPKLSGIETEYLNGFGNWSEVPAADGSLANYNIPYYFGALFKPSGFVVTTNLPGTITANTNFTVKGVAELRGTNTANKLTVTNFTGGTLGDVSITEHGLVPTAPNDSTKFLNGLGQWAVPPGSGTNAIGITGSPVSGYITYWTGTNTISGDSTLQISGGTLTLPSVNATTSITTPGLSVTGTTGNIYAGNYTPVVTPITYLGAITCSVGGITQPACRYLRVGNTVYVNGRVQVNGSGAAVNRIIFGVTLPTASSVVTDDLMGNFSVKKVSGSMPFCIGSSIDALSNICQFEYIGNGSISGLVNIYFNFSYDYL